ncbi:alpha/beta hydrolase [Deinococcus sp. HMF7604]|uniref:alpha/beta fold hydrolase n=1 Tax=Deinococcus betulae TaxID=2873312 RepID=UPI001CCD2B75|nr:alpha/beta fold hydrolase [Deinococcus betulae]MBZ9752242.1 alpha/beta hydrolase [Deinococcus betulae]
MDTLVITMPNGQPLQVYRVDPPEPVALTVFWHHGTPNVGWPPAPLFTASAALGVRWLGHDRPGYGDRPRHPGRTVADAAHDVAVIARALGIGRYAVMGHSGGGPHALACAALCPEQVVAAVSLAGLAPYGEPALDYFEGMYPGGRAELQAALKGEPALASVLKASVFDPEMFTPHDHAALAGDWSWLNTVVRPALAQGPGGMIDDDLAYVRPWGVELSQVQVPVALYHGGEDRIVPVAHAAWLAAHLPRATLTRSAGDGHLSVLNAGPQALHWLLQQAAG